MDEDDKKLPKKIKLPGRLGAIKTFFDAATNLINRGVSKEGIINFAKQEFGEVSDLMLARINQLFRKKESGTLDPFKRQPIDQEGNVIEASFRPGVDKKGKVVEESPSQASGIMSLKGDETFDELLEMEKQSPLMERLSKKVESLQKGVNMTSGLTRTIAREILMNKGIQIAKGIDPIELLNRKFGAKVVSDVSDLADELIEMERAGTPTKNLNVILKQEGLLDMKIPGEKPTGLTDEELQEIQKAIDEEDMLLKFDPKDREPNAMGGINRIGFEDGTKKSFIKKIPRIGKLASGLETIMKKFGTDAITTADKIKQPPKKTEVLARDFEKRNPNPNRQMTEDELEDFYNEIPDGEIDAFQENFDGTIGSANKIRKELKDYQDEMFSQYKAGRLDPEPGDTSRSRYEFLKRKMEEMEMSGDRKLMTFDEIEELQALEQRYDFIDLVNKAENSSRKMTDEEIKKLKEYNDMGYQNVLDVIDRKKQAEGGLSYLMGM